MLKKDLYNLRFAIIPLIIFCIIMQTVFKTVCLLKAFTGIDCPACGLTHATVYLVTGRFQQAIDSNPTVFLWLITIFLFCFDRYIHNLKIKVFPLFFIITGITTIIWYCFKLCM